jgi:DNA-binding HxlR family transcriptional regulator
VRHHGWSVIAHVAIRRHRSMPLAKIRGHAPMNFARRAGLNGTGSSRGSSAMKARSGPPTRVPRTLFIGKWTVLVLSRLTQRPHRHGELRRSLGSVSQRMLTRTLRNLELSGLVSRQVTRSRPIAVEYSLTTLGRTFLVPLRAMCRWVKRHGLGLSAAIELGGAAD